MANEANGSVPVGWVVVFLLVALGVGAAAVVFLGGELLPAVL